MRISVQYIRVSFGACTRVNFPNGISIGSVVYTGVTVGWRPTDSNTDYNAIQTPVAVARIYCTIYPCDAAKNVSVLTLHALRSKDKKAIMDVHRLILCTCIQAAAAAVNKRITSPRADLTLYNSQVSF